MDGAGQTTPLHPTPGLYENLRFSPDGKRLAFEIAASGSRSDIWVKDLALGCEGSFEYFFSRRS